VKFGSPKILHLRSKLTLGKIIEIIYFPVHNFYGFKIVGCGNSPLKSSIQNIKFITYDLVRKVFLLVNNLIPSKAS